MEVAVAAAAEVTIAVVEAAVAAEAEVAAVKAFNADCKKWLL